MIIVTYIEKHIKTIDGGILFTEKSHIGPNFVYKLRFKIFYIYILFPIILSNGF